MPALDSIDDDADAILEKIITFDDGSRYERLQPMTNFRKDGGVARILYRCRRVQAPKSSQNTEKTNENQTFVMKIKIQIPSQSHPHPTEGPHPETAAEIHALQTFAEQNRPSVPHLVTWKKSVQGKDGLFPGGYVSFTIMTLMPGESLLSLGFWSLEEEVKDVVRGKFLGVLRDIWSDGFILYDRALRNILWEKETGKCSIVDFEHYHVEEGKEMDEKDEMQRWGLLQRPAMTWYQEWGLIK